MANFNDYNLAQMADSQEGVYDLSDRLIPQMAAAFDFDLPKYPTEESLQNLIGVIGPAKTLQDNIGLVQERIGSNGSALQIAAEWVTRSGLLLPVRRSFSNPNVGLPQHKHLGKTLFNTGVARWTIRRAQSLIALQEEGYDLGQTLIFAGNRRMGESEHETVAELMKMLDVKDDPTEGQKRITEAMFAQHYIVPLLSASGIRVEVISVNSAIGDEIFTEATKRYGDILGGGITTIGNAPAAIQVAGQFRENARKISRGYNDNGTIPSLYMVGDSFPLATNEAENKSPATHQNTFSALGPIARAALYLHRAAKTFKS